jgi:hypothetical protein
MIFKDLDGGRLFFGGLMFQPVISTLIGMAVLCQMHSPDKGTAIIGALGWFTLAIMEFSMAGEL